jgi:hypothetical protein
MYGRAAGSLVIKWAMAQGSFALLPVSMIVVVVTSIE